MARRRTSCASTSTAPLEAVGTDDHLGAVSVAREHRGVLAASLLARALRMLG